MNASTTKFCASCGERSEGPFDACWNCGRPLGEAAILSVESEPPPSTETARSEENDVPSTAFILETFAVLLITCLYPIVAHSFRSSEPSSSITLGRFLSDSLEDIGWAILVCCLLVKDRTFQWNLPTTWQRWAVEIPWGIGLYFLAAWFQSRVGSIARNIGFDSHATFWSQFLKDPKMLIAFRAQGPTSALYQELLFRVYLQTRLTKILRGRAMLSVPLCAWLFAEWHGYAPAETAALFASALVFGIVYQISRRVPRLVVAHTMALSLRGLL
jgi:membrane protease YdiL (CAAX protease family)